LGGKITGWKISMEALLNLEAAKKRSNDGFNGKKGRGIRHGLQRCGQKISSWIL